MTKKILCALTLPLFFAAAHAKDLGTQGTTWPILERDMRQLVIESAARVDWEKASKDVREKNKRYLDDLPIRRMAEASETRVSWVDPSITLESDIQVPVKQADGSWKWQVMYKKGHKHNPLDAMVPMTAMLFVNGGDAEQIQLAKKLLELEPWRIQVVEAGAGNVRLGTEALGRPMFYANDQLLTRFKVSKLPTLLFANERTKRGLLGLLELAKPYDLQATRAWEGMPTVAPKESNEKTTR